MGLCPMKNLLLDARADGRAAGAFNVGSMEMLMGVVAAAERTNTPIVLQIAEKRLGHSPLYLMGPMMVQAARNAKVDMAVQFDHGVSVGLIRQAVELGFTSIMFDGSGLPVRENVRRTAELAAWLADKGVNLEAEIGVLGGNEGGSERRAVYTDPEEAALMAEKSGCDALAVAIGNAHGHYKGKPKLNFAVLEEIRARTDVPLVLHGGSGIPAEDFTTAIRMGVSKINIATVNFDATAIGAREYLRRQEEPDYFGMNEAIVDSVRKATIEHIKIFSNEGDVSL
ncbi:MAG: ketose-bisphosphate aldolase [Spirochaetaceae bacterium]|nr:ketose-bisphosphate aldolase [Spirochaetaceae bacterium]